MTEELKAKLDALSEAEKEAVVAYLTGGTVTTLDDTGGNGPGPKV